MYNKLFASILDSSIWLEEPATKVVWITFLAAMDEDGFAHFSALKNLANRAVLPMEETEAAVKVLESPDENSADKDHEGRRIERVPGGWLVLNARKYHMLTTRAIAKEKVRERVTRFRKKKQINRIDSEVKHLCNAPVTPEADFTRENCNAPVTLVKRSVTQSDTDTDTEEEKKTLSFKKSSEDKKRCTQAEAEEFCESIGLPASDGEAMFLHFEEKGWAKIKDWKATIRKWKSFGYLPSQKNAAKKTDQFRNNIGAKYGVGDSPRKFVANRFGIG